MYLMSLPNQGGDGAPKICHSDDPALTKRWIAAENRPGFGVYYSPNPLKPEAARHGRDSLEAIKHIYFDIDFKDIEETADEAAQRLNDLLLRPSRLANSGHGRHVDYELKEPIPPGSSDYEKAGELQAALIRYFGADPNVRP